MKKTDLKGNLDLLSEKLIPNNLKNEITTPFEKVFPQSLISLIQVQTNAYAFQHGNEILVAPEDEIKVVLGILLLSGYCSVPYRELYWPDSPDTHNEAICKGKQ